MLTLVRFLKSQPPYNAGETAGFDQDVAATLVDAGVAVLLTAEEVKAIRKPKAQPKVKAPEMVLVRFRKHERDEDPPVPAPFIGGETAAFTPEIAERLIAAGVADEADKPSAPPVPAGSPKAPGAPTQVTFVKSGQGYLEGESATFPAEDAAALIKAGLAVLPGDAPKKPAPTTAEEGVEVLGREGLESGGAGSGQK